MIPTGQIPPSMNSSQMPEPRKMMDIAAIKMLVARKNGFSGILIPKTRIKTNTIATTAIPARIPPAIAQPPFWISFADETSG